MVNMLLGGVTARGVGRLDVRYWPKADIPSCTAHGLTPDVLVTNTNLVTAVVLAEVRTIPIVFISVGDPVGSGFVDNEAHPTGNLTGFANWEPSMAGKWLGLFKEVAPQVEHVGWMMHPETAANIEFLKAAEAAAPAFKIKLVALGMTQARSSES
jgi:putative ABC transport system substrate-binding protein